MVLSQAQVLAWLGHFLWPFLRITGMFLTAPMYNSAFIPAPVKAVTAAAYAACLALWLPNLPPFPGDPASAIYQGITQLAFGAVLGCTMQIIVSAVASAGEIVGLSMGLGFAELQFREASSATPVLYDLMFWAGTMAYIATGGPILMFAAIAHSFQNGVGTGNLAAWGDLTQLGATLIGAAVWLAMPVIAIALCVNIVVGLTTVFAPQMNLLTIGFPLLILVGFWVFTGSIGYMNHDLQHLMSLATDSLTRMLGHV
jgi:flagellar biosynthetic protein FliR